MARPTRIDLNPIDLNYYPFMISLERCNGSCNDVVDLSTKIRVPNKAKEVSVKLFNMIIRICEAKIQIKNRILIHDNAGVKIIPCKKKVMVGILAHVFVRLLST